MPLGQMTSSVRISGPPAWPSRTSRPLRGASPASGRYRSTPAKQLARVRGPEIVEAACHLVGHAVSSSAAITPSEGFCQDDRIVPHLARRLALIRVLELRRSGITEIRQFILAYTLIGLQYFPRSHQIVLLDVYVARTRHAPFRPADAALGDRLNASFRKAGGD
jgi:hypothetical protein